MNCPACRTELTPGEARQYETLLEHVTDPNGEAEARPTLECPNQGCPAHQDGVFWAQDGEGPYRSNFGRRYGWIDDNPVPFGSFHRNL